ncbi:zinc-regulated TonB-dependent outer membrane receptor [Hyalangium rubrum]|uniref:Zinc-regulated TonB-dependent outer membrane receptor n=1 Tax=Hyalangium rubrum TaxID=3103134 RepID=A0ABU5GUH9_9BACT|nr:zinc-regulated TonB-dependent outer membrane receptor [Hyalangium sp. s54d21]MDY7224837.1 zinc-regulated TonB-dependent outer membrane receptor [Hyalangium sp. s54d21]
MSSPSRRFTGIPVVLISILSLSALSARAQETQPAASPPAEEGSGQELSPEEQAEIEAAIGKDTKAEPQAPAESAPTSGASAPLPVPQILSSQFLELSFVLDVALAAFTAEEPLQGGAHDPLDNGFTFQQLELSISSVVDPYLRFNGNIVFSQFGVEVEEAYVTSLDLPANLQVRAGQFLTRFGRLNNTHPHAWDFADQPFVFSRVFGGEGNRGLGLEVSWLSPLPWYLEVVGSGTDATGESTARSFFGAESSRVVSPFDFQFTGAVKQFFPFGDDLSLLWGLSAATGPNASGYRNRSDVYGTDLYLKYRPTSAADANVVSLQAELLYRRRQVPDDLLSDWGGYAQVLWRFSRRWATSGRYEFGTAARDQDGRLAEDPLDPEWTATRQRISANVTFWPTEFSRLRLQAATDRVGWRSEPDYSAFLTLEAVMGAHGAHAF